MGGADAAEGVLHSADGCGVRHFLLCGKVVGDDIEPETKRIARVSAVATCIEITRSVSATFTARPIDLHVHLALKVHDHEARGLLERGFAEVLSITIKAGVVACKKRC